MASELPPDPYAALGVPKDADADAIKKKYRKMVLTCHPDKVTGDDALKKQKTEEFHKIQQAYDILGDETKRATYDAEVRLAQLRKEKLARGGSGPNVEVRTASYDIRTAAPAGATFPARGPARYEERRYDERKPSRYSDDDRYYDDRSSARKHSFDDYSKRSSQRSSRPDKDIPIRVTKVTADRTRSDAKKSRDRDERRDRSGKFVYIDDDSDSDEKARYEAEYKRRSDEAKLRADAEEARKIAEARRKDEARRSSEDTSARRHRSDDYYDSMDARERKLRDLEAHVKHYTGRAEATRPSPNRTSSTRDYYEARPSKSDRPEAVRRSSARPKEREARPISSGRDRRGAYDIVDWDERSPPSFKHSVSSPSEIKTVPRAPAHRSYTESSHDRRETSPTPGFRRSETMPTVHTVPRATAPPRSSTLRNSESATRDDSGYSSPSTPENSYPTIPGAQPPFTKKVYQYPASGGGVSLNTDDVKVANGHRTVLREPERHRHRSPSPLGRPPMGANRTASTTSAPRYVPTAPQPPRSTSHTIPPPLSRAQTMHHSPDRHGSERSRAAKLFGEMDSDYTRSRRGQPTSYNVDDVQFSKKYGPEDVRWSGRGRESDARPSMSRNATFVY